MSCCVLEMLTQDQPQCTCRWTTSCRSACFSCRQARRSVVGQAPAKGSRPLPTSRKCSWTLHPATIFPSKVQTSCAMHTIEVPEILIRQIVRQVRLAVVLLRIRSPTVSRRIFLEVHIIFLEDHFAVQCSAKSRRSEPHGLHSPGRTWAPTLTRATSLPRATCMARMAAWPLQPGMDWGADTDPC